MRPKQCQSPTCDCVDFEQMMRGSLLDKETAWECRRCGKIWQDVTPVQKKRVYKEVAKKKLSKEEREREFNSHYTGPGGSEMCNLGC